MGTTMTKDGFWNPIEARSPRLMKEFKNWVDKYKVRVGWNKLFNDNTGAFGEAVEQRAPKIHELPDALQIGIFIQFVVEQDPAYTLSLDFSSNDNILRGIRDWFEVEESLTSDHS